MIFLPLLVGRTPPIPSSFCGPPPSLLVVQGVSPTLLVGVCPGLLQVGRSPFHFLVGRSPLSLLGCPPLPCWLGNPSTSLLVLCSPLPPCWGVPPLSRLGWAVFTSLLTCGLPSLPFWLESFHSLSCLRCPFPFLVGRGDRNEQGGGTPPNQRSENKKKKSLKNRKTFTN